MATGTPQRRLKVCLKTPFSFSPLNLVYLIFPSSQLMETLSLQLILHKCLVPSLAPLSHTLPPSHSSLFSKGVTPSWPELLLQLPSWSSYQTFLPRDDSQKPDDFPRMILSFLYLTPNLPSLLFHSIECQVLSIASKALHREGPSCFPDCLLLHSPSFTPLQPYPVFPELLLARAWWGHSLQSTHLTLCLLQTLIPESPGPESTLSFLFKLATCLSPPPLTTLDVVCSIIMAFQQSNLTATFVGISFPSTRIFHPKEADISVPFVY